MSFYITLPSNASMDLFPKNTLTSYTTKLSSAIKLEGEYEVALTEIMFPFNWNFRDNGNIMFTHVSLKADKEAMIKEVVFNTPLYVYDTIESLIKSVNYFTRENNIDIEFAYDDKAHIVNYAIGQQWNIEFLNQFNLDFGIKYDSIKGSPDKKPIMEGTTVCQVI